MGDVRSVSVPAEEKDCPRSPLCAQSLAQSLIQAINLSEWMSTERILKTTRDKLQGHKSCFYKRKIFFILKAIQGRHKLGGQWATFTQSLHIPSIPETYILRDLFLTGQKWTEDRIAFPSLVWGTRQEDWEQTSTSLFDQNLILSILDLDPEAAIHFLRRNCLPPSPCVHSLA